ncbi:MAG: aldehyde dehydrogenase family protein [Acidimicrobiales bacterium]
MGTTVSRGDRDAAGGQPAPDAAAVVARLRRTFDSGATRPLPWRQDQLRRLLRLLAEGEDELVAALHADMGKPAVEGRLTDLAPVGAEVKASLRHLAAWARPERVRVPLIQRPGRATVVREPYGVALVIAPWNYPVHLLLLPMAAALAAGNCVVAKPSELVPATSAALARLAARHLDPEAVTLVEGGAEETRQLLAQRFDTIFYTGNARVGRLVMEAAAKHLTPVTLELGGKSPVVVAADADLDVAARRIAWGKFMNAGQTCVAPDYVLVDRRVEDELVDRLGESVRAFYGSDPRASGDYARIVNERHFDRLAHLLAASADRVAVGGDADRPTRYIGPTVLRDVGPDAPVMEEEIFGPLLPVLPVDDVDEAVAFVDARPKPLALYVFARAREAVDRVVGGTSSGGVGVNCTVQHLAVPGLPFGGVGESGMGAYHGQFGFDAFSHRKAVLEKPTWLDPPIAYPPYTRVKRWILRRAL